MTRHQIKELADGTEESDAVALRQLRLYITTESADSEFALKQEKLATAESDARYVKDSELALKMAPLVSAQQTTISANVNMQPNRITNLPNGPLEGDAVSYDLLLEHLV